MMSLFAKKQNNYEDRLFPLDPIPSKEVDSASEISATQKMYDQYWRFPIQKVQDQLVNEDSSVWLRKGEQQALNLFHAAAARVPAYKDFLKKNRVEADKVVTITDFKNVPSVDKENYLRAYPLESLCWDGRLDKSGMISVSSGSSGKTFFWPRSNFLDLEITYIQELLLTQFFDVRNKTTLYIDCFAMGMYIAGPIILSSALRVSQKGYPMVVVSPGLAMEDIMKILATLAPNFSKIILAGYPPYIKDVIEEGVRRGIAWNDFDVNLVLAGEGFNEGWRDYVATLLGGKNPYDSIINLYGTADSSLLGHETPLSIAIRRLAGENKEVKSALFSNTYPSRMPTLVQYYPTQKYFESINSEIHFTASNILPLIRYNIHDDGGILEYDDVVEKVASYGVDPIVQVEHHTGKQVWKLPFVYLYGRSDFTVVFYGANIYPENIKDGLEDSEIRELVTGRFIMSVEVKDKLQDQYLLIRIELADNLALSDDLKEKIAAVIKRTLLQENDEYRSSFNAKGEKAAPVVTLHVKGDEEYFTRQKNKQRWTKKD